MKTTELINLNGTMKKKCTTIQNNSTEYSRRTQKTLMEFKIMSKNLPEFIGIQKNSI